MALVVRARRPATVAVVFMVVVGALLFAYTLVGMTSYLRMSPWDLMFYNPTGGSTLFAALLFCTIPPLLQAAVAFAIERRAAWARIFGAIAAGAITLFCTLWLVLAIAAGVVWIAGGMPTSGMMPAGGDFMDLIGVALFVPVALVIAYLDGRAALLAVRRLRSA